ncbi:biopolymer transporter ExbD [uncultured Microbulbifer sp.]|uniref:biopolymer transporter ExbD n=1 Tax=uncultured Microbulbifer sp. TaxID=348147 RepID=UPI002616B533|nr:biopolymer transporter ExbD [uncultured Microbulbifer sp.]
MAMNLQKDHDEALTEQHEINVTPFIDVMLVLLIIFMVAAPLATVSVPVALPSVEAASQPREDDPLYITLQKDLTLTLGESQPVTRNNLVQQLNAKAANTGQRILLRADIKVEYGEVMAIMRLLAAAGYHKIALVGREQPAATAL